MIEMRVSRSNQITTLQKMERRFIGILLLYNGSVYFILDSPGVEAWRGVCWGVEGIQGGVQVSREAVSSGDEGRIIIPEG